MARLRNTVAKEALRLSPELRARLAEMGSCIRARRKELRLSSVLTAEAARISRVTLHRIEKGEPSVSMAAYLATGDALGLSLDVRPKGERRSSPARGDTQKGFVPLQIPVEEYPQLRAIAWHLGEHQAISPREALDLYERNWRHLEAEKLNDAERDLIDNLKSVFLGEPARV